MKIRDRIKSLRRVKASELAPNPKNWRAHSQAQQDAMRGILADVGYAGAALARELPDGSLILIDGHLRAELTPDQKIPVLVLDVTEAEANKILATFDPLGAMAETNTESLDALLAEIDTESEALSEMLEELANQNTGDTPAENEDPEIKPVSTLAPAPMTWVLVGIPTVEFGSVAAHFESIAENESCIVEMTSNETQ